MGGVISSEDALRENPFLVKLSGAVKIDDNDPFWNTLFSFNLKFDDKKSEVAKALDDAVSDHLQRLMDNTRSTGNFAALLRAFLRRAAQLKDSAQCENKIFLWQTSNALILVKYIAKFLTQRLSEAEFVKIFDKHKESHESDSEDEAEIVTFVNTAEEFLSTLTDILIDLPVDDLTLPIHIETVKTCLVILSSQLYYEDIQQKSTLFSYFLTGACHNRANELTRALLKNYLQHNTEYRPFIKKETESLVIGLAGSLWSMLSNATGLEDSTEPAPTIEATLGSLSLLFVLILACHQPINGANIFKEMLSIFHNSQEVSAISSTQGTFTMDYNALYDRLCATVGQQPPMLLLYLLLHRNVGFRNFVLSRINLENLILPVLRILHEGSAASQANPHHMYLALIAVLILSEDDFFCKVIHETMVRDITWIESERALGEISLGGLTIIVFARTLQKNTIRVRDRYLHTNSLAALANLASAFKNLSPVVCQKLIGLLEMLTKRHAKMVELMRHSAELDVQDNLHGNYHEDITYLEEGIRTLLEILNSALTNRLRYNSNLIYSLLYHKELFDGYRQHPMFQDLLKNITLVIEHFSTKIVDIKDGGAKLIAAIESEALVWPTDKLQKFPDLKFRYIEDENTVEFFVPYVWRLVYQHAGVRFDPQRIKVFNALIVP